MLRAPAAAPNPPRALRAFRAPYQRRSRCALRSRAYRARRRPARTAPCTSAPAVPHGRYSDGSALPNSTTCGQPTAAAACAGPESTVTSPAARSSSATRRGIGRSSAALCSPRIPASAPDPGSAHIRVPCPAARSRAPDAAGADVASTSAQRSFGQYLLLTARRRRPRRMVRLLPI